MSGATPSKFIYKLNAMENAGAQITPAKFDYKGKREAVLAYVSKLERDLAAQRTALLALSERIRREGMQGVANKIEEIIK